MLGLQKRFSDLDVKKIKSQGVAVLQSLENLYNFSEQPGSMWDKGVSVHSTVHAMNTLKVFF